MTDNDTGVIVLEAASCDLLDYFIDQELSEKRNPMVCCYLYFTSELVETRKK